MPSKSTFRQRAKHILETTKLIYMRSYSKRKFNLPNKTFNERVDNKLPSKQSVANLHIIEDFNTT